MERVRTVHQARAAETADALVNAAYEMMRQRPLAEVSVAEIVRRAGVSVGAFYARFGCKEALLDRLCEDRLRREGEEIRRALEQRLERGAGLRDLVATYVDLSVGFFERNAVLLREVVRLAYGAREEEALSHTVRVNQEVDRACVRVLLARRREIRHPEPERAAALVPLVTSALLRSLILLRPVLAGPGMPWTSQAIHKEVSRCVLGVLGLEAEPAR